MSPLIVGIGGTLRPQSSSERALAVSLEAARAAGARTQLIAGPELSFPPYEYGASRTSNAQRYISVLRECDGLIIASPSYHGGIPGLLKNAIDYIEDLARDERPYLTDRGVGLIVCAAGWQAVGVTLTGLRSVVHALRGWPTPLGAGLNTLDRGSQAGFEFSDKELWQLREVGSDVTRFALRSGAPERQGVRRMSVQPEGRPGAA
jgi:FMN reductase